jgi:hypothetical protein
LACGVRAPVAQPERLQRLAPANCGVAQIQNGLAGFQEEDVIVIDPPVDFEAFTRQKLSFQNR